MSRVAAKIELNAEESDELNRWLKSGKTEQRKVERAKIVLCSAEGKTTHQIARELGTRPSRVSKWRTRFAKLRVPGLEDEQRSGRRVVNDESVERRILDQLTKAPPKGFARWTGRLVAEALGDVSDDAVWRVMRKHDLHLDRRQSWCVSTDPEFSRKASEIVARTATRSESPDLTGSLPSKLKFGSRESRSLSGSLSFIESHIGSPRLAKQYHFRVIQKLMGDVRRISEPAD